MRSLPNIAKLPDMTPRVIGSRQAAAMLGISRSTLNGLAKAGVAPGPLRKEPGGHANLGRYVFDAEVIERVARERIEALEQAIDEALPPQLPLDGSSVDEMRAAS